MYIKYIQMYINKGTRRAHTADIRVGRRRRRLNFASQMSDRVARAFAYAFARSLDDHKNRFNYANHFT